MTINLQTGGYIPPQPLPGAQGADIQVGQKQVQQQDTVTSAPVIGQKVADPVAAAEEKRYEHVVRASQSLFKDVFVVSDKSFAIFKDASGQYITRYTSLRDGRVTYIPEQRLLQAFENSQRRTSVLEIQA